MLFKFQAVRAEYLQTNKTKSYKRKKHYEQTHRKRVLNERDRKLSMTMRRRQLNNWKYSQNEFMYSIHTLSAFTCGTFLCSIIVMAIIWLLYTTNLLSRPPVWSLDANFVQLETWTASRWSQSLRIGGESVYVLLSLLYPNTQICFTALVRSFFLLQ